MRKITLVAFAASALVGTAALADPNPESNGVNKNCFGQGRAEYSRGDTGHPVGKTGEIISERARTESTNPDYPNQNVQLNKEYKEACQAS